MVKPDMQVPSWWQNSCAVHRMLNVFVAFVDGPHVCYVCADAVTQAWLLAHKEPVFGFPSLVRFSWQSTTRLLDEHCCKVQFPCDSEEEPGQQALGFGQAQPLASNGAGRHSYMRARKLQRMQAF